MSHARTTQQRGAGISECFGRGAQRVQGAGGGWRFSLSGARFDGRTWRVPAADVEAYEAYRDRITARVRRRQR